MNELLMNTIIFKYFLKILKIKINYDFVFDFSKKFIAYFLKKAPFVT